jgi:LPS-assembly lipoprotein
VEKCVLAKKSVMLLVILLLSACGYHLRGALNLPEGLKTVYLQGGSPQLQGYLKKALKASSAQLADSPEQAGFIINILQEDFSRRVLSLSSRGRSNELELYYRLEYELTRPGNVLLMARQPLEIRREYFNNQQDIIAKDNEEAVIRSEMYQQAVRTIITRAQIILEAKAN